MVKYVFNPFTSNLDPVDSGGGGGGTVVGPGSSVDGDIAVFNGATGQILRDSTLNVSSTATTFGTVTSTQSADAGTGVYIKNTSSNINGAAYVHLEPNFGAGASATVTLGAFGTNAQLGYTANGFSIYSNAASNNIGGTQVVGIPLGTASFQTYAGNIYKIRSATGGTTVAVTITDYIVRISSTPSATSVTLPGTGTTNLVTGQVFIIKDGSGGAAANNITVSLSPAGALIDGAATAVINTNYGAITVVWNGTNYNII